MGIDIQGKQFAIMQGSLLDVYGFLAARGRWTMHHMVKELIRKHWPCKGGKSFVLWKVLAVCVFTVCVCTVCVVPFICMVR